jgi:hypothetical protein
MKVDAAALPAGGQHLRHRGLDAFVRIRDHQLDATQPAPPQLAQELGAEHLGFGRADVHASISRRPSLLTPTAMMAATDTMRPFWGTFT